MQAIIGHGGAGPWEPWRLPIAQKGLVEAVATGIECLKTGYGSLDACEQVIKSLEDLPSLNAGLGSVLNLVGEIEMDASVMKGRTLQAGACAAVRGVRHPITLARRIMEETDHVLVVGDGAETLAKIWGLEERDPRTAWRVDQWRNLLKEKLRTHPRRTLLRSILERLSPQLLWWVLLPEEKLENQGQHGSPPGETVGCVVLDSNGEIVAGTSTGGMALKFPGRLGDTPVIGAGTYASSCAGASATGEGEAIIRVLLAKEVCDLIEEGSVPQSACECALKSLRDKTGREAGVIALSTTGEIGAAFNSRELPVAYWQEGMDTPTTL